MVDGYEPMSGVPAPVPEAPDAPAPAGGFLSSTLGKLIVGGVILFAIAGAAAAIFFFFFLASSPGPEVVVPPTGAVASTSTPTGESTETPTERPAGKLNSVFRFRNPFQPAVSPPATPTSGTAGSGDTSGTTSIDTSNIPDNTLVLTAIETVDGSPQASFVWNGTEYTVGEGERLGDTPWRCIQINESSVVMLYGDSQVTLSLGQGITK